MVVFRQKWLYLLKSGCVLAKVVLFDEILLYSGKVVVFGQKLIVFGQK